MALKYVAFDLETSREVPPSHWRSFRPLGISCASTYAVNGREIVHKSWVGGSRRPELELGEMFPAQLTPEECLTLFEYIETLQREGYTVLTWNGLSFDFDILFEELGPHQDVDRMFAVAMLHTDLAFAMFCDKGFFVSLDSACIGLRIETKLEGIHASEVPSMWHTSAEAQARVIEYNMQDAKVTGLVYEAMLHEGYLRWYSKSGKVRYYTVMGRDRIVHIPDVSTAMQSPEPDTSWMSEPARTRGSFVEWLMTAKDGGVDDLPY